MDRFATETWIHIIQYMKKRDWVSLSTTCREFRELAQEQLNRRVPIGGGGQHNTDNAFFARSLDERTSLATHIFTLIHGPAPEELGINIVQPFTSSPTLATISSLSSLRVLKLHSILIDESFCTAIRSLPSLQKVKYDCCTMDPGVDVLEAPNSWGSSLSTVVIRNGNHSAELWAAVIPPIVQSLKLKKSYNCAFSTLHSGTLFSKLMGRPQGLQFTTLIFTDEGPENIGHILASCPCLRRVSFPLSFYNNVPSLLTLPSEAVPLLEYFSGSANYIDSFVSGRPIHSVNVSMSQHDRDDVLLGLRESLVPVTTLKVNAMFVKFEWLQWAPMTLRTLEVQQYLIDNHHSSVAEVAWLFALSQMHNLKTLHVSGPRFPQTQQRHLIDAVAGI